jgi:hypothetical protein
MRKLFASGLAVVAGMVSAPVLTPKEQLATKTADYRKDPRFQALKNFFQKANSPAKYYAGVFLEAADDYGLDWRLLPSLAFVESGGGKAALRNNWFGWNSGRSAFRTPGAGIHVTGFRLAFSELYRRKNLAQVLQTYNSGPDYAPTVRSVMRRIAPNAD